jgi:phosphatidate cytidylyltransferase
MLSAGDGGLWVLPALVTALMFALVVLVGISGAENIPKGAPLEIAGTLWVGVLFPYFALLRNLGGGIPALVMMLLVVIASDTGAYFGGRAFGAHKLAPRVSPNKTIEGSIAGLIASIGAGLILRRWAIPQWSFGATAALSGIIAVLAQVGDLAGSAFKRVAGVKDSGWIFPGHGGLLDRTCSLVFATAFSYYCFK